MSKLVQYKINRIPCQICFFPVYWLVFFSLLACFDRDVWQPLTQIRLSLSVSLGAGQIIFLAGINATENMVSVVFIYSWFI